MIFQTFHNKVLPIIVNSPWFIRNDSPHHDLEMNTVAEKNKIYSRNHKPHYHESIEMCHNMLNNSK